MLNCFINYVKIVGTYAYEIITQINILKIYININIVCIILTLCYDSK